MGSCSGEEDGAMGKGERGGEKVDEDSKGTADAGRDEASRTTIGILENFERHYLYMIFET